MRRLFAVMLGTLLVAAAPPPLAKVLGDTVDTSAAQRFATVWKDSGGHPTAARLQSDYLKPGDHGLEIFTRGRIENAEHLAKVIAANPDLYRDAVERCLPWVMDQDASFRAVNLGLRGLLPNHPPPAVAIVVGADNSGGTAGAGMQVIGLEVICRLSPDRASFDQYMRNFFAHEATHTFQTVGGPKTDADWLLTAVIEEGTATYVAHVVTGIDTDPKRSAWAEARGDAIWADFLSDRKISAAHMRDGGDFDADGSKAVRRWVMNAGSPPDGWPGEAGYWVGEQIVRAYIEASTDPEAAIDELLSFDDPGPILARAATRIAGLRSALSAAHQR